MGEIKQDLTRVLMLQDCCVTYPAYEFVTQKIRYYTIDVLAEELASYLSETGKLIYFVKNIAFNQNQG